MDRRVQAYDFSLLPPHVIAQVLKNVKFQERLVAAQLCKSWYFASCDPILSQHIYVRIYNDERLNWLHNLNRPFGKLKLSIDFSKFDYQYLFAKFGQYIKEINFSFCKLSIDQLIDCLGYLTNLRQINWLSSIVLHPTQSAFETNEQCEAVALLNQNLRTVKEFRLNSYSNDLEVIRLFMSQMVNLETLDYHETGNALEFQLFADYLNQYLVSKLLHLVVYSAGTHFFRRFAEIKTQLNLHTLKINYISNNYSDDDFELFCKKLSNLKVLSTTVTEKRLIDVSRFMTNLVELDIHVRPNEKFYYVRNMQTLKKLAIITYSSSYDERDEEQLLQLLSVPLLNLEQLHLRHRISTTLLELLCENYKHLRGLKLSCMGTSNASAIYKNLVNLKSLELKFFIVYPISEVKQDVDINITNLQLLEEFIINKTIPGVSWDLVKQLPNLKPTTIIELEPILNSGYVNPNDTLTFKSMQRLYDQ